MEPNRIHKGYIKGFWLIRGLGGSLRALQESILGQIVGEFWNCFGLSFDGFAGS